MSKNKNVKLLIYGSLTLLIVLLPVLVWLQYSWLGQLSEAEKVRMKSNLEVSAQLFSEDFDRIMTSVHKDFSGIASDKPADLLKHWRNWQGNTQFPSLIDSVYLITHPGKEISRFDSTSRQFTDISWPDFLAKYESFFGTQNPEDVMKIISLTHGPVLDSTSFIMIPFRDRWIDMAETPQKYFLIRLNDQVLRTTILPGLVQQYFYYDDELSFYVAIMKSDRIYFASDHAVSLAGMDNSDAVSPIGKWISKNLMFATTNVELRPYTGRVEKIEEELSINRLAIKIVRDDTSTASNFTRYFISQSPRWELRVKHIGGSLEAVIQSNRQLNILLSFGILLILIIAVLLTLLSARRLEALAGRQMEFVSGVTHELRTPLAVIRSAGENIADGLVTEHSQLIKYGTVIRDEGRRLSESVEQALQFAGIRASVRKYENHEINLHTFFEELLDELNTHNQQLYMTSPGPQLRVFSDRAALRTVFTNLLQNAIKFSPENEQIHINIQKSEHTVDIAITDKGIGIPDKDIRHIFEPFYRAENASSKQIEGYGLGLAVVQSIIKGIGARIMVSSHPDQGTVFTVSLNHRFQNEQDEDHA